MFPLWHWYQPRLAPSSNAQSPETPFDRAACEKAAEGPDALRQYVQRMQGITNLYFFDYVNEAQAVAWAQNNATRPVGKATVQTATVLQTAPGA